MAKKTDAYFRKNWRENIKKAKSLVPMNLPNNLSRATMEAMEAVKDPDKRRGIIERCGENVAADGIQCTHCGALEVYKDAKDPKNLDKWYWMIRAFRVDNASECRNCNQWFVS